MTVFNWGHRTDLYSGKHRRYGMNLQVVVDLHGRLVGMSQPMPGSWHDSHCLAGVRSDRGVGRRGRLDR